MAKPLNRARMTVSGTPGTGNVTLGSAASGFQTFAAAGAADGDVLSVLFEDGSAWEISTCVYAASGTSLARTLVASSTGSLLSLTSAATATVIAQADDLTRVGINQSAPVILTPGATVSTDCRLGNVFRLTPNQNFTLANPTNPKDNATYMWRITQGATPYTISYGTKFKAPAATYPALTASANARDWISAVYSADLDVFDIVASKAFG